MTKRERKYVVMKVCETCVLTLGLLSMFYMGRAISLIEEENAQAAAGGAFFGAGSRMLPPPQVPFFQNRDMIQGHDQGHDQMPSAALMRRDDHVIPPGTTTQAFRGRFEPGSSIRDLPPLFQNGDEEWQRLERMASGSIPKPHFPWGSSTMMFRPGFLHGTSTHASSTGPRPPMPLAPGFSATSSREQAVVGVHMFRNAYRAGGEYPVVQWMSRIEGKVEVSMHRFNAPLASPLATRATTTYAYVGSNWAVLLPNAATTAQERTGIYIIILKSNKINPKTGESMILGVSQPFRYEAGAVNDDSDQNTP